MKNEIKELLSELRGLDFDGKIKAIEDFVEEKVDDKESEMDQFALDKADRVKYEVERFIDILIAEYHKRNLQSTETEIKLSVNEIINDLRWLATQINEIKSNND